MLDQGLALADWNGFEVRRAQSSGARHGLRGRGIASSSVDRRRCSPSKVTVNVCQGIVELSV